MTDLRVLRPYLDSLVDDALDHVPTRPTASRRSSAPRLRVIAVALVVIAVVITALVLARTTTASRSVRVPPAQETNGIEQNGGPDNCVARMEESMKTAPGPVDGFEVFDHGTGIPVRMSIEEYCDTVASLKAHPEFSSYELHAAGVSPGIVMRNGVMTTEYYEYTVTDNGGSTDMSKQVPVDVVRQRLAAIDAQSRR